MFLVLNRSPDLIRKHYFSKLDSNLMRTRSEWTIEEEKLEPELMERSADSFV